MRSVERDDLQHSENMEHTPTIDDSHQLHTKHRTAWSSIGPELSMINHHTKTPQMSQGLAGNIKIMKRPADTQWLKGSYVSKRARWEGPAVPSPTPLPDGLERDRRRRQLSARPLDEARIRKHTSSRLSKSFPNHDSKEVLDPAPVKKPMTPHEHRNQSDYGLISSFYHEERMSRLEDFGHQPDDLDELQDNSQEDFFLQAPQSSVKSKKNQTSVDDRSLSDLEPDDLIVITPRTKPSTGVPVYENGVFETQMSNTGLDNFYDLPELPRGYRNPHAGEEHADEDSFVTEVAPSSRNLEQFQFRKRKSKFPVLAKSEQDHGIGEGGQNKPLNTPQPQHSASRYTPPNIMQITDEIPMNLPQEQVSSIRVPAAEARPLRGSQTTPPKSDKSSSSWDLVQDLMQNSSFTCADKAAQTILPPKSTTSTSASPFTTPKKAAEPSLISSITGHLLRSFRKSGKLPHAAKTPLIPACSNDMNTQSFNTTPPGSTMSPDRKSLPNLRDPLRQHSNAEANAQGSKPTEMDKIQLALSQTCPSSSRAESPHNIPDEPLQEITVGDGLTSQAIASEHYLSSSQAPSPIFRPQSQDRLVPGLPDLEFASFTNKSFLFLGEFLAGTNSVAGAAPEDDRASEPSSASSQRRSPVPTDEEQEGHKRLKHHQESVQVSLDSCQTAVLPEPEARVLFHSIISDVGSGKDVEKVDHQETHHICMNCKSTDLANSVAVRSSSVAEDRDQLLDNGSCHNTRNAMFDADESSMSEDQTHLDSKHASQMAKSIDAASPKHRTQISLGTNSQDDQAELGGGDVRGEHRQIHNESGQESEETNPRSVLIHQEAISVPLDDQRDEQANGSETSWEGCGPQSPWAAEKIDMLSTTVSRRLPLDLSLQFMKPDGSHCTELATLEDEQEMSWVTVQRPITPDHSGIKPFQDFLTPTSSPGRPADPGSNTIDTLSIADAAIRNPWTSHSKNQSTAKPGKRVSFGVMPLHEDSWREKACPLNSMPRSPPPAQTEPLDQDEDIFHDGTTLTTTFNKHFAAATRPRQFKRILPEVRASQLDSSPAKLEAQAEAFIAADHDDKTDQWPASVKVTPRHLKTRSDSNTNSIWKDEGEGDDSMLSNPFSRSPLERVPGRQASFDMASALGEAAGFLEDWSVDTVLKPVKEKESVGHVHSTGMRRRKLFGLV